MSISITCETLLLHVNANAQADAATVAIHKEAIRGIEYIGKSLPHALSDGSNIQARHGLCEASMIGGLLSGNRHDIAPPLQTLTIAASR
jgi:alcohol dehydrogenase class IV